MLSITRKVGESVVIGDDIIITVKKIRKGFVRLSIEATKDFLISRAELRSPVDLIKIRRKLKKEREEEDEY